MKKKRKAANCLPRMLKGDAAQNENFLEDHVNRLQGTYRYFLNQVREITSPHGFVAATEGDTVVAVMTLRNRPRPS
jgi:hypothetical protein